MAERPMSKGAPFHIYRNAKYLRQHATEAEKKLWNYLRTRPLGFKFRRQHPLAVYIADFYCHKANLVIEVDGMIHSDQEVIQYDQERDHRLRQMNLIILRFSNHEVLEGFELVTKTIIEFLNSQPG